jgi:hypothetical protein
LKSVVIACIALIAITSAAIAQSSHSVTLTWTASPDGGTVNVYRAPGACSTSAAFTKITTGVVAAGPYVDNGIAVGNYCYQVTAVVGGAESVPSNQAPASVLPSAPTVLVTVAK